MASSSKRSEECNRLVWEAVNESSVSKLKLAMSSYLQMEVLASLAECNEKGETPLGVAMNGKNVDLIDELVNLLYNWECIPTYTALDQLSHQIPIVKLIDLLLDQLKEYYDEDWLVFLGDVFSPDNPESAKFTRKDKIIALELIGAMLIINLIFTDGCTATKQTEMGLGYWRVAMTLRFCPPEGEPLLPKIADVAVPSVASSVVFGSAVEVLSMEGLDLLEGHFKRNSTSDQYAVRLSCKKLMQLQALLVIRRISNQDNHELPHRLYLQSLLKFGSDWKNETNPGSSALVINTYLLILEQMAGCDPKLLSRKSFEFFLSVLHNISLNFIQMLGQPPDSLGSQELSFENLLAPTKFIGAISKFFPQPAMISSVYLDYSIFGVLRFLGDIENFRPIVNLEELDDCFNFVELVFNFVAVLKSISSRLSSHEKKKLEEYYSNYIRNLFPDRTTTVLHAAVGERKEDGLKLRFRAFQAVEDFNPMVKHLLKLGADPNAIDEKGRTPLLVLAENERFHLDENLALFQALVDAGSHLDIAADDGYTVLSFLKAASNPYNQCKKIQDPYYESLINTVLPLSCQCARVIRRHEIRYDNRLPTRLQKFVSRHSDKDPYRPYDLPEY